MIGKTALLETLTSKGMSLLEQLTRSSLSVDYTAWRHRFLLDRLRLWLWIAIPCFITFVIVDVYQLFINPHKFNEDIAKYLNNPALADHIRQLTIATDIGIGLLLIACLVLHTNTWARRYPVILFLFFSWSITLTPQIIGTFMGLPNPAASGWILVFLAQATLMPVHWRLHLISQVVALAYYVGVNPIFGLTKLGGESIYNAGTFVILFWFCVICDVAVFLYERLQRAEFESRRELRIFLHAVSHDLRTPVMGTSLVLQNLLKKSDETVSVHRSVLERLLQGSDRQLNLINSLLEAHTTEVQGVPLHREPIPLHTLVESVLSDLSPILTQNRIVFINRISANLPLIDADANQLWRVLCNLISNAVKHNPNGIHLTIDAEVIDSNLAKQTTQQWTLEQLWQKLTAQPNPHNQITTTQWIRCSLQDNGVGIEPKQCKRLFDLYARGSRARYMPGLGLGLYLCQQIILAHGGKIGVNSQPGEGSTFWFTVPIVAGQSPCQP